MSPLARHSRFRLALFWGLFALAATATAVAVAVLYTIVRAGQSEQEQRILSEETARARAHVREFADNVRRSTIAELAGFHADGLARTMRRWDDANAVIAGTFEWDPVRGDLPPAPGAAAASPSREAPAVLWRSFARWRAEHPDATRCDPTAVEGWHVRHVRTLDNPDLPARDMRYQAENIDVLAYAGRPVDPWAGWAARPDDASAPWVIWYRPGPDAAVRGCYVDVRALLATLRADFSDTQLARFDLRPAGPGPGADDEAVLPDFPSIRLVATPGAVLATRHSRVQIALALVAVLAGVFIVGAAMLSIYSRREARDAERKTTFVSQVSHELRTPLTSIRMFADMLSAPSLPEEKRMKFAGTISRESARLSGLIERLLAFNALARGKAAVSPESVDVAGLLRDTLDEQEPSLRETGLHLEREIPAGTIVAATDQNAFKQAVINLLDNAARYAATGGLVRVTLVADSRAAVVRVADHGPGIPRVQRARVFDPFVQGGSRALTDKAPGLGLGLSIARGLLRSAGGDLVLVSADGGCTFEIRLPVIPSP